MAEYEFGIICAGAYGVLVEYESQAGFGFGVPYGAVLLTVRSKLFYRFLAW